jgi:hypothetical protein
MTTPTTLYRARRYFLHGHWRTWYEPCPVIRSTAKTVTVSSQNFPDTPLYPGGEFRLKWDEKAHSCYHSRHGEWFWAEPQPDAFLFPSKDVLECEDFVTMEARAKGWEGLPREWLDWQQSCWILASMLRIPLQEAVDLWKLGGESAFREMTAECRSKRLHDIAEHISREDTP